MVGEAIAIWCITADLKKSVNSDNFLPPNAPYLGIIHLHKFAIKVIKKKSQLTNSQELAKQLSLYQSSILSFIFTVKLLEALIVFLIVIQMTAIANLLHQRPGKLAFLHITTPLVF